MTQNEFYTLTNYTQADNEHFDFWKMHEDYCNSPLSKEEYCQNWADNYNMGLGAVGVKYTEKWLQDEIMKCENEIAAKKTTHNRATDQEELESLRTVVFVRELYKIELMDNYGELPYSEQKRELEAQIAEVGGYIAEHEQSIMNGVVSESVWIDYMELCAERSELKQALKGLIEKVTAFDETLV